MSYHLEDLVFFPEKGCCKQAAKKKNNKLPFSLIAEYF